jgi:hypothetical protein
VVEHLEALEGLLERLSVPRGERTGFVGRVQRTVVRDDDADDRQELVCRLGKLEPLW